MAKKLFTEQDVRKYLHKKLEAMTQAELSRDAGIKPQNLSPVVHGGPMHGKLLSWLGFRRFVVYERIERRQG